MSGLFFEVSSFRFSSEALVMCMKNWVGVAILFEAFPDGEKAFSLQTKGYVFGLRKGLLWRL
jgi:hypothetical protein